MPVEQAWREKPAADGDVSPTLAAEGANRLGSRGPRASGKRSHAGQPVMCRPLPGPSCDQRIAPDVAASSSREDQPIQLRDMPSAQRVTKPTIDDRQQLRLWPDGTGGDDP